MALPLIGEKLFNSYLEQETSSSCELYFLDVSSRLALSLSCERLLCNRRRIELLHYYLKGNRLYYRGLRDEQNMCIDSLIEDVSLMVLSAEQLLEEYRSEEHTSELPVT